MKVDADVRTRLRWAIDEAVVLAGILFFWLVVAAVAYLFLALVGSLAYATRIELLEPLYIMFRRPATNLLPTVIVPLALFTSALYVLVRAGTLLLDRHQTSDV